MLPGTRHVESRQVERGDIELGAIVAAIAVALFADEPPEASTSVSDVVVTGARAPVASEIDRQVYVVAGDPQAEALPVIDILAKLPSVTIAPNGRIQLLGQPGVTVMIDGKPSSVEALRNLPGSEVDRIEVMTNPSAQFSASGTAGIINVVTRHRRKPGLTGTVSASADTQDAWRLGVSPSLTRGRWTFGASLGASASPNENASVEARELLDAGGAVTSRLTTRTRVAGDSDQLSGSAKIAYRFDNGGRLSLKASRYQGDGGNRVEQRRTSPDPGFIPSRETTTDDDRYRGGGADLTYERDGPREGETLSALVTHSGSRWDTPSLVTVERGGPAQRYRLGRRSEDSGTGAKVDYRRALSDARILNLGAAFDVADQEVDQSQASLDGGVEFGPDYASAIKGRRTTTAAYVTYQFAAGRWTVAPGLRLEAEALRVRAGGVTLETDRLDPFPSLHLRRELGPQWKLDLSYTRRIDRPEIQNLDPVVHYFSSTNAYTGNPDLKPVFTDSWEARLDWQGEKGRQASLVGYRRAATDVWGSVTTLRPDGVFLYSTINAGDSVNEGVELALRGPLLPRWSYAVTGNLFHREQQVLDGTAWRRADSTVWSLTGSLDYKAEGRDGLEGDQGQVSWQWYGPERTLQGGFDSRLWVDLTWRRALTPKVSLVATVRDALDSARFDSRGRGAGFRTEGHGDGRGPAVKLALTWRFGGKP